MLQNGAVLILFAAFLVCAGATCAGNDEQSREQKILQIQQLIQSHDLTQADQLLSDAIKEFPADPGFDNLRGIVAAQEGDYALAERSFSQAVARSPKFTNAFLNLGRLYQEHASLDPQALRKALRVYSWVLQFDASNAEANYQSAVLLLNAGEYKRSLRHIARLPIAIQGAAQALSVVCADRAGLGEQKGVDQAAAQLISKPDFSEADARQVLPTLTAKHRDDVSTLLLGALERRQTLSPEMQHALGLAYERSGKLPEARVALEKSITSETLSVNLLLELARVAHKQHDYQGALGYLAHARDLEPNNARLHYDFGLVCVDMNLVAEARNSFEKSVQLEPENASYNYAMGAASVYRHDPAEAVPYFEKYLKLKPEDPRAKLALGDALYRAKDYDAALPWLTQAVKNADTAAAAHFYLGSIALEQHRSADALRELSLALKANPDYADAFAALGQYFLAQKDYVQAEKEIRRALELDPNHFAANFYLLTLFTRTGDSRREGQAKRFEDLQKLRDAQLQDFLRIVEVRPFEAP